MALGPENFQIYVAYYYVDGVQVTPGVSVEIDPAISHTVGAKYKVRNQGASTFQWWDCCITVFDMTHNTPVGSAIDHGQGSLSDWKERHINVGYITDDITFRVRIWANQDYNAQPPYPPKSGW